MRARTAVGAVGVALVLVAGVVPARGVGGGVSAMSYRWASAITFDGPRVAIVGFNDVRAGVQPWAGQYACVGLVDQAQSLYAVGCTDQEFASIADLGTARAVGSIPATVWRYTDTVAVGTTVLHYDIRWNATTTPGPFSYASAAGCAGVPWASAGAGVHIASLAAVDGAISSPALGTARFDPAARAWYTAVGEAVGASASTGMPVAPPSRIAQCVSRWTAS